jgi:hypothetical protein
MKIFIGSLLMGLVLWAIPVSAQALTGPVVGPFSCTFSWTAPTVGSDGLPLTVPITSYKIYVQQAATPLPVPGTTLPVATVTGVPVPLVSDCHLATGVSGIVTGQNYAWVTAVNANGESALSAVLPFVWSATAPIMIFPGPPGSFMVK